METADHDHEDWDDEFAPWDGRRVPVTLLGGYLGAGKTTVLNELLAVTDRPIAVIVNDIGQINIDASLVRRHHGDTIELTDGCICCSLNQGLGEALDGLRSRDTPPDHLLIELSGAADPRRVIPWANSTGFTLDGVVVLADAEQFLHQEADPHIGPLVRGQVEVADLILLSKGDLVSPDHARHTSTRLSEIAPNTPIVEPPGPGASASVLGLGGRRPGGAAAVPAPSLFDHHVVDTIDFPQPATAETINALLDALPPTTVRAKGVAMTPDETALLVQVVGTRRSIAELPAAEAQDPTDLVVISIH